MLGSIEPKCSRALREHVRGCHRLGTIPRKLQAPAQAGALVELLWKQVLRDTQRDLSHVLVGKVQQDWSVDEYQGRTILVLGEEGAAEFPPESPGTAYLNVDGLRNVQ
jgi:hypothetical protein